MLASSGLAAGDSLPSRPPWWILVGTVLFSGYLALLIYSDLTRPAPLGFVLAVSESEMIVRAVTAGSPAAGAGLAAGDRVVRANSRPMRNRLDWLSVEMNLRVDRPLRLDVARASGQQSVVMVPRRAAWTYWITPAGITLLSARTVQLVTLVLAIIVAFKRPLDPSARIGAWLLGTLAVYSIVWQYQLASIWRALPVVVGAGLWLPFVSSLAIAAILFTFFATFPQRVIGRRWMWWVAWAPMAVVVAVELLFVVRVVYQPDRLDPYVDWTPLSAAVTTAYTAAALTTLALGYRQLTDVTQRRRVRVLVIGSVIGLLSALPVVAGYWGRSEVSFDYSIFASPLIAIGSILALALPVSFAYAILRHRLFNVGVLVRFGLQYALARRVLVSIVPASAALFLIDLWVNRHLTFAAMLTARGWVYVGLAALAIVARFRRNSWLDSLDRRFFRERLNAQRVLHTISGEVRAAKRIDDVAAHVVTQIEAALHPEYVALLLKRPDDSAYRVMAKTPATGFDRVPSTNKIIGLLQWLQKPIRLPAGNRAWVIRQLPPEEVSWLRRFNIDLIVPVRLGGGVQESFFVLGPKRSEEPYSAEDQDLLMAIGDNLALLLARESSPSIDRRAFEECPTCGACYDVGVDRCPRDDTPLAVTPLPRLLGGRYRLDTRIGRGGMGTVYAALDTALDRSVAVKLLRDDGLEPQEAARFQSEARLAASLAHPNVVTIHDIGVTASGRAYFIMELLEGSTLRETLEREGPLPRARMLGVLRGIGAALDIAHERELIHRDLKPENVFLCRSETSEVAKVLDFGLAKVLQARSGVMTAPGLIAGTPQYMAPEHLSGGEPSGDWDLWALSVIAFEMITGTLPFAGLPGRLHTGSLPPNLRDIFTRALSLNPLDRPTSAQELVDALERALISDQGSGIRDQGAGSE